MFLVYFFAAVVILAPAIFLTALLSVYGEETRRWRATGIRVVG